MDPKELEKVCCNLRSVTLSSKGGVPFIQLEMDYKALVGKCIPYKDFGHNSLESFIRSIPQFVRMNIVKGNKIVEAVTDKTTAHIANMISKQKNSKTGLLIKLPGKKNVSVKNAVGLGKKSTPIAPLKKQNVSNIQEKSNNSSSQVQAKKTHSDPKMIELEKAVCINLRAIAISSKTGVLVENLQKDYRKFVGGFIPFDILGYASLEDFLETIPGVIKLVRNSSGQLVAEGVPDSNTAHISKLISKQKTEKNAGKKVIQKLAGKPPNPTKNEISNQSNLKKTTTQLEATQNYGKSTTLSINRPSATVSVSESPNLVKWSVKNLGSFPCIRENITNAHFSTLTGLHNLLFAVSYMDTLKEKILNFGGYLFLTNSEEWKKREFLISILPQDGLKEYCNLLCIKCSDTENKDILLNKLMSFIALLDSELVDPEKVGMVTNDMDWYKKCQEKDEKLAEVMDENNKLKAELLKLKSESKSSNERSETKTNTKEEDQSSKLKNLMSELEKLKEQKLEADGKVKKIQKEKGQIEFQLNSLKHEMKIVDKQRKDLVNYLSTLSNEKEKMKTFFLTQLASISDSLYDLVDSFGDENKTVQEIKKGKKKLATQTGKIMSLKEKLETL